ncbi:MAG: DUF4340 domain-containing protein [Chloroflexi bacterium]|nr:DUF4340 domain-containing protein [Chloroflexota bacterium]
MNLKVTIVLVALAIAVGAFVYINPFKDIPEIEEDSPWFFQVAEEDIESIEVIFQGDSVKFVKVDVKRYLWEFEEPAGIPPSSYRWGGITLLLSGPRTRRDLTPLKQIIEDPAEYGLDNPSIIVTVGLTQDRTIEFRMGDKTTDGLHTYGQVSGFPQLFIIADSWGDVIARLVTEPPIPRWYEERDPESIVEVNITMRDTQEEATSVLQFKREDEGWFVKDTRKDDNEEALAIDTELWAEIVPLLGRPSGISVAVLSVDDRDYTPWGINDDSSAVELRFAGVSDRGSNFIDGTTFTIGSRTDDGQHYYAQQVSDNIVNPVLLIDAEWVDTFLGFFDDIPYADPEPSAAQSN